MFVSIISTYFDIFEASCGIQSLSIHQGVPREDRHGDHDAEHRSHQRVEGRQDPDADHGAHLKVPGLGRTGRFTVFRHEKHIWIEHDRTDRTKISDTSRVSGIRFFSAFCLTSNHSNPSIWLPSATIEYVPPKCVGARWVPKPATRREKLVRVTKAKYIVMCHLYICVCYHYYYYPYYYDCYYYYCYGDCYYLCLAIVGAHDLKLLQCSESKNASCNITQSYYKHTALH